MDKRTTFLNIYNNLPIKLRNEIVLVFGDNDQRQNITWNIAFQEISNNTELGKRIIEKLADLKII